MLSHPPAVSPPQAAKHMQMWGCRPQSGGSGEEWGLAGLGLSSFAGVQFPRNYTSELFSICERSSSDTRRGPTARRPFAQNQASQAEKTHWTSAFRPGLRLSPRDQPWGPAHGSKQPRAGFPSPQHAPGFPNPYLQHYALKFPQHQLLPSSSTPRPTR